MLDVLEAKDDAIILTMDGARRGMEGNVARAFARRWPDVFAELEDQLSYPVALGRSVATVPESECPFSLVLFASTLNHADVLGDAQKGAVISSALRQALDLVSRHGYSSVASAVMTGGWRLPFAVALGEMFNCLRQVASRDASIQFSIYVMDESQLSAASSLAARKLISISTGVGTLPKA